MKTYKRPLTARQGANCEQAKRKRCVCRCGGSLHGASHDAYLATERAYMEVVGIDASNSLTGRAVESLVREVAGLPGLEAQVRP